MADRQNHSDWMAQIQQTFADSIAAKQALLEKGLEVLIPMAETIVASIKAGGKLFLCGNGGSAADAQHLAAELLVRLRPHVNRNTIPALALATDMSTITACGNDYSFNDIYARPLAGLGTKGDVLLGITTSGRSPNILEAMKVARSRGIITVGFLGGHGGEALALCDMAFLVPSTITGRIQESHITAGHALMELIEDMLLEDSYIQRQ